MPLIIDGHNLIPKIPGLSLSELDDEDRLTALLLEYCRLRRRQIECYFDNPPAGRPLVRNLGSLVIKFARSGQTADLAIEGRLLRLGRKARNWLVISSDARVQAAGRAAQARVQSSEAFADDLLDTLSRAKIETEKDEDTSLSQEEVESWLALFRERKDDQK